MILCCGEALIDMLPRELPDGRTAYLPSFGGALFNTAIALGRLGERTGFFSGISTDLFGRQIIDALSQAGVNHANCIRSARMTTLAFVEFAEGDARYTFCDENSAGRMIVPDDLPEMPAVEGAHFGAISLVGEPCGSAYEALAMRLRREALISLDPNIRPGLVTDEKAYRARLERMAGISDIIKLSADDLEWLFPDRDEDACAEAWLGGAANLVVLTRGAKGASAWTGGGRIDLPAPAATVVDTVGAGDSFNAGLLSGLRRVGLLDRERLSAAHPQEIRSAIELAMRVAAFTVSRPGANPPWAKEIGLQTRLKTD